MRPQRAVDVPVRSGIRRVVLVGVALLVAVGVAGPSPASAQVVQAPTTTAQGLRPSLPPPTGEDRVGVVPLHLVDRSRPDPWVPAQRVRELMVSLWYPARQSHDHPLAPWLPPAAWARFEQDSGVPPGVLRVPLTHGRVDAPVDRQPGGRPVVLYSPGLGGNRDSGTVLVEQLVSLGYVVATIDHPHDASEVEFPRRTGGSARDATADA